MASIFTSQRLGSFIFGLLLVTMTAFSAPAREEIPAELRAGGYGGPLMPCNSEGILSSIQSRFARTESRYWGSTIEIVSIEKVRQTALRPHGLDLIPRRYCEAVAVLSNKTRRALRYAIIEDYAFSSLWDGIHFCVAGFDRQLTSGGGDCARFNR
ncbi:hypothetical protein MCEMSEM23_01730 [Rhabdaerophilaceae bacterium]